MTTFDKETRRIEKVVCKKQQQVRFADSFARRGRRSANQNSCRMRCNADIPRDHAVADVRADHVAPQSANSSGTWRGLSGKQFLDRLTVSNERNRSTDIGVVLGFRVDADVAEE